MKHLIFTLVCIMGFQSFAIDLNRMINDAAASGQTLFVLPEGDVEVDSPVILEGTVKNLEINGYGKSRLIFKTLKEAFFLNGCRNVSFKGFSIDYNPLPFTQGTITSIDGNRVAFKLHEGYPDFTKTYQVKHPLFFKKETRNWAWGEANYALDLTVTDSRSGSVAMFRVPENLKEGDFICFNKRSAPAFKIRGLSGDLVFEDLKIYSAPDAALISRRSSGSMIFRNITIERGALPKGASEARLISTSADGINIGTSRQGPVIENCDFSFMGDDSVNLHGAAFPVLKKETNSFITVLGYAPVELESILKSGDQARIMSSSDYSVKAVSEFVSIEMLGASGMDGASLRKLYPALGDNIPPSTAFRITLKGALPEPGDIVDFPAINSPGFKIVNSRFHDHRARAIRIMASNGEISSCKFWNLEQSAISLGPEYAFWMEAGWPFDIKVVNNDIKDVCMGGVNVSPQSYFPGAIAVFVRTSSGKPPHGAFSRNIEISGNRIGGSGAAAIFANSVSDLIVGDNEYSDLWRLKGDSPGSVYGLKVPREPLVILNSKNINLSGNKDVRDKE